MPTEINANTRVDAKKAFLGVVNIDNKIVYTGIGNIYGEQSVGNIDAINDKHNVNVAIISKYLEL